MDIDMWRGTCKKVKGIFKVNTVDIFSVKPEAKL